MAYDGYGRESTNARWALAAANVEPQIGDSDSTDEEATEEKAPAPRLSASRQRRAKRNAEAESKAENAESISVGPRWGASARRGPTDKRKRIKEKVIVIEAEDRTDVISFGEVAAGKQLWYLLQTAPNRENVAASALDDLKGRILENGQKAELETLVPIAWVEGINQRTQRVTQIKQMLVPGYVMVKCVMDNDMHTLLQNCYYVKGFMNVTKYIGPSTVFDKVDLPLPMQDDQLASIFAAMKDELGDKDARVAAKPDFPFEEGDVVTVNDGAYKGFSGQVMGVDVKEKTVDTVLVIFSKATEVTLNVDQIVKANPKVIKMLGPVRPQ